MPSSTPKPGTGVSGIYFAYGRGTVLDYTGIVVATSGDRFTVEFHSGHRATYTLSTEIDFWERTERALGYVAKWVAEHGHEQPADAAEFARVMLDCARRPNVDDLHKALAIFSPPATAWDASWPHSSTPKWRGRRNASPLAAASSRRGPAPRAPLAVTGDIRGTEDPYWTSHKHCYK